MTRAGPYGLSVAAHLKAGGVATHTFGEPMSFWRRNMPIQWRLAHAEPVAPSRGRAAARAHAGRMPCAIWSPPFN
jgi:hypothetical protein